MLLAIDVGNTNIVLGIFRGSELTVSWRLASATERTADELWVLVSRLLAESGVATGQISVVILSSVVPSLTQTVSEMLSNGLGHDALRVDSSNTGLPIRYENPDEVGADRLVNGVAARELYGETNRPVIVVDFGTATSFDAISAAGEYLGGIICPGVEISADALFQRAARLPRVDVRRPDTLSAAPPSVRCSQACSMATSRWWSGSSNVCATRCRTKAPPCAWRPGVLRLRSPPRPTRSTTLISI